MHTGPGRYSSHITSDAAATELSCIFASSYQALMVLPSVAASSFSCCRKGRNGAQVFEASVWQHVNASTYYSMRTMGKEWLCRVKISM